MTIMERIVRLMEEKNIKRADLLSGTGIPQSSFWSWASANVDSIPSEYVSNLAAFFDVSCDEILTGVKTKDRLTENQLHLINEFENLDWDGQQVVLGTLVAEKRRMTEQTEG